MKLEAGKYYRTRGGKKAYVASVENPFDKFDEYPVLGLVDGDEEAQTWDSDGSYYGTHSMSDPRDLITDWRDDATVRGFVLVNAAGEVKTMPFPERELAEKNRVEWLKWFPDQGPYAIVYVEGVGEYDLGAGG